MNMASQIYTGRVGKSFDFHNICVTLQSERQIMYREIPGIDTYVFSIIHRVSDARETEVLVQAERSVNERYAHIGTRIKFPGGRYEVFDGDLIQAVRRENVQETGLLLKEDAKVEQLMKYLKLKQLRIFFLIEFNQFEGKIRTGEPIRDGGSLIAPPKWMTLQALQVEIQEKRMQHTHEPGLVAAARRLAQLGLLKTGSSPHRTTLSRP